MSPMACTSLEVLPWTARWCGLVGRRRMNKHFQQRWPGLRWGFIVFLCLCWQRHVVAVVEVNTRTRPRCPRSSGGRETTEMVTSIACLPACLPGPSEMRL